MMADDGDGKEYRWETGYEKTWEVIREDDEGLLEASVSDIVHRAKRKRLQERLDHVRLGMMRHLYVIIDFSEAMMDQDLKPTRQISTMKLMEHFVDEYFDQNPISQLGIIITKNKRAEKLTELSGNPKKHINELKKAVDIPCVGEPSLQNALELAAQTLKHLPGHVSREVVIIFASLTTCDPGNIYSTIEFMKQNNMRCSVIGLAAEIRICRVLCKETNGSYNVILDETHFKDLLTEQINPPPMMNTESSLIRMGFPHHMMSGDSDAKPAMCMCHLDSKSPCDGFSMGGYFCPQCRSKYCELPVECKACGLTLVSAPHLARSYHHLFPLDQFEEISADTLDPILKWCVACQKKLEDAKVYQCKQCSKIFCLECDLFLHETLHACPGCANTPKMAVPQET